MLSVPAVAGRSDHPCWCRRDHPHRTVTSSRRSNCSLVKDPPGRQCSHPKPVVRSHASYRPCRACQHARGKRSALHDLSTMAAGLAARSSPLYPRAGCSVNPRIAAAIDSDFRMVVSPQMIVPLQFTTCSPWQFAPLAPTQQTSEHACRAPRSQSRNHVRRVHARLNPAASALRPALHALRSTPHTA
jgi:hypothetical protein